MQQQYIHMLLWADVNLVLGTYHPGVGVRPQQKTCAHLLATWLLQVFPSSYDAAIRQAQEATKAAIADGHTLLEVEFPSSSITAVQGAPLQTYMMSAVLVAACRQQRGGFGTW